MNMLVTLILGADMVHVPVDVYVRFVRGFCVLLKIIVVMKRVLFTVLDALFFMLEEESKRVKKKKNLHLNEPGSLKIERKEF